MTAFALVAAAGFCAAGAPTALPYPTPRKVDVVEVLHGTPVSDPYRWLEDPDAPASREWIEAQNRLSVGYLASLPEREPLRARLTALWDYERVSLPVQEGGRYFFTRNTGLQNQSVLFVQDGRSGKPRVLLDPNPLSADGTVALASYSPSRDGRRLAYALAQAGSDWMEWRVRDVGTAKDLDDRVRWSKFSGADWSPDGKGFYYQRFDPPGEGLAHRQVNRFPRLCFHRIGEAQEKDRVVYERRDQEKWMFSPVVSDDGRYLVIHVSAGTGPKNLVFVKEGPDAPVVELVPAFEADYTFVGNEGSVLYFRSDLSAPRRRVISVDLRDPARDRWRTVVAERAETLQDVSLAGDTLFTRYLSDAKTLVRRFSLAGAPLGVVELPGIGSAFGFGGRRTDRETFYSFTSYTTPATVYRFDLGRAKSEVFFRPETAFRSEEYVTDQVFLTSRDGTKLPMFVTYRKGTARDGRAPTHLYGYGGFGASMTPSYSPAVAAWLESGGRYAVANVRGGGEYGESWHQAGTRARKQNVFDDFIAAAEHLVAEKWTHAGGVGISGASNGGLLVGACLLQRPGLFGAAAPAVGVMDMLRFHKSTIGWAWVDDYGSPDDPDDFRTLLSYSPLHNVRAGARYPPTLVTTADHDDRVVPAHSFKFAAALQEAQEGAAPILIRIETRAGHGAGKPTSKIIAETADRLAFLLHHTSPPSQPQPGS